MPQCEVCFRHCKIEEGMTGFCGARTCRNGKIVADNYGTASLKVLEEIKPCIDAMNIDLKSFSEDFYKDFISGDLQMTKDFIRSALETSHVELTTLIIPGGSSWIMFLREMCNEILRIENAVFRLEKNLENEIVNI